MRLFKYLKSGHYDGAICEMENVCMYDICKSM